jgi:hypothetical protein
MITPKTIEKQLRKSFKERFQDKLEKRTNPYSGQSEMLTKAEAELYDQIKQAELDEDYKTVEKGLSKFSRMNASAYMTLLD